MTTTIYDYIAKNNRNTIFILLLFPISLIVLVFIASWAAFNITLDEFLISSGIELARQFHVDFWNIGGLYLSDQKVLITAATGYAGVVALPVIGVCAIWSLIAYFCGDKIILSASDALPVKKSDAPDVYRLVENVAIAAGLPTPKLYIIADESLNAFATGRNPEHASITLTTGIIDKLSRPELEAVIAHEMAHIGNHDIRLMMLIITGIGAVSLIADLAFRSLRFASTGRNNKNAGAIVLFMLFIAIALAIFAFVLAPILRLALSRTREYGADTTAAMITRNPAALANALAKISADPRVEALDNMPTVGTLCIENPLGKDKRKRLFDAFGGLYATHPPIAKRIEALNVMAGF